MYSSLNIKASGWKYYNPMMWSFKQNLIVSELNYIISLIFLVLNFHIFLNNFCLYEAMVVKGFKIYEIN